MMNTSSRKKNKKQRIVICGSMSFYSDMIAQARQLSDAGVDCIIPESDDPFIETVSDELFQDVKLHASMRHIRKIRDHEKTYGILVINRDKHGVPNYIGPNTFAEIAVALAHYKKIYLFQGIPEFYRDELVAWNVTCLDCNINRIIKDFIRETEVRVDQLNLFEE